MRLAAVPGGTRVSGAGTGSGPPEERRLWSRSVFEGRLLEVCVEGVELPGGARVERELVRHPGASAVLPVFREGRRGEGEPTVVLVRQYRHAVGRPLLEIPAGTLEAGEDAEACARRELREETGLHCGELRSLGALFTSPGFTDERVHLYLAQDPEQGAARPEAGETLECRELPLENALRRLEQGEIPDAKTVCALLRASRLGAFR